MNPWHLRQAVRCLQRGGVIAYPTEAVYGLGCDPLNPGAVTRLLALKQRDIAKGLILIAAEQSQLRDYILPPDDEIQTKLDATWPGPVTWLLRPQPHVPYWLTGEHNNIAVRVTEHPLTRALCELFGGAIISTSANPSQLPPARTPITVRRYFHNQIDCIVHGRLGNSDKPTIIRDAMTDTVVRPG